MAFWAFSISPPDYDSLVPVEGFVVGVEARSSNAGGVFTEIYIKNDLSIKELKLETSTKYPIPKVRVGDYIVAKVAIDPRKVSWWAWEISVQDGDSLNYEVFVEMSEQLLPGLTFLFFGAGILIFIYGVYQLRKENSR